MGWQIVKQPNGLYGRFSEIVDDFTHNDLTELEVIKLCLEKGLTQSEAKEKLENGKRDLLPYTQQSGGGLSRWNDCIQIIKCVHGVDYIDDSRSIK